jgi:hypothetical protein
MTVGPAAGSDGRGHRCDRPNRIVDPIPKSDARGAVLSVVRGTDDIFDLAVLGAPGGSQARDARRPTVKWRVVRAWNEAERDGPP